MAQVSVSIAGRTYRMACDDGEEAHLEQLATQLDAKIAELRSHFGEIGDQRITVMAALTLADDLATAQARIGLLEDRIADFEAREADAGAQFEEASRDVAKSLGEVAQRIERIARGLDGARKS